MNPRLPVTGLLLLGTVTGVSGRFAFHRDPTGTGSRPDSATTVTMTNRLTFEKDTVRVAVGQTVAWRNSSDLVHSVTADLSRAARKSSVRLPPGAKPFDSGQLAPGATFSHRFRVAGTYRYFCVPHEAAGMIGTVIVSQR